MGRIVCKELAAKPVPFVVIDRDPEALRHLAGERYLCVDGDATEAPSCWRRVSLALAVW